MVFDAARGVTVLFGGVANNAPNGETWEFDGVTWTQRAEPGPAPRSGHSMVYDAVRGVTVLFGGYTTDFIGDTWEWNGTFWRLITASGPSRRTDAALAYDPVRQRTVLFGGCLSTTTGNIYYNDLWEWDGINWTLRSPAPPGVRPAERAGHAMAFDPAGGVVVLFGGAAPLSPASSLYGDTWTWNGTSWFLRLNSGPAPRHQHAMVYHAGQQALLLVGGDGYYRFGDTWSLCTPPTITTQPDPACADGLGNSLVSVAATGLEPLSYTWQILTSAGEWLTLGEKPISLPCGGNASATSANSANTSIHIDPCAGMSSYSVRALVSHGTCSVSSQAVVLTVGAPDLNADGVINSQDFFVFLCNFFTPGMCDPLADVDINQDGSITSQDFFDFLAAFFTGC